MQRWIIVVITAAALVDDTGCNRSAGSKSSPTSETSTESGNAGVPGEESTDDKHSSDQAADGAGHAHGEISLGTVTIADIEVELAQGHGKVEPGKLCHLVVKLPYNDRGETAVRAWLGTADRTESRVARGTYAPSHNDYDIHAEAPEPLPVNLMWWVEIEKPDGSTAVGSVKPLM